MKTIYCHNKRLYLLKSNIEIEPKIVSPKGILLLGRSNKFNTQQNRDFEIIKRQYKNIADIMTYDDLINRINNIINSLKIKKKTIDS